MTIAESRSARHGNGGQLVSRGRRRRWILFALGALFVTAAGVLTTLAGTYQPLQFGDSYGGRFPGLPLGTGLRFVNTFAGATGDIYAPPQAGVFSLMPAIFNTGPETVTIAAVSILSPQQQADIAKGIAPWPLVPAGPVRWSFQYPRPGQKGPTSGISVTDVRLDPGQGMVLGIPLRMSGTCYDPGGWTGTNVVYVKERFGIFTHWVAIQFQPDLIMHEPSTPTGEPAKDLICPAK
jgi:hypothetical protein